MGFCPRLYPIDSIPGSEDVLRQHWLICFCWRSKTPINWCWYSSSSPFPILLLGVSLYCRPSVREPPTSCSKAHWQVTWLIACSTCLRMFKQAKSGRYCILCLFKIQSWDEKVVVHRDYDMNIIHPSFRMDYNVGSL